MRNYANPESLVTTEWIEQHKADPGIAVVEVDVDPGAYSEGHIPGAIGWNWQTQLCDTVRRDIISRENLEQLLSKSGIGNDTTIVLYGDNNNWFAAWAFWQLKMYGHKGGDISGNWIQRKISRFHATGGKSNERK